jgi:hypothetical protein
MLTPDKYFDLKFSVINVSASIIRALHKINILSYNELEKETCQVLGEDAKQVFPYALNFLFLLNKIDYNSSLDSLILKR